MSCFFGFGVGRSNEAGENGPQEEDFDMEKPVRAGNKVSFSSVMICVEEADSSIVETTSLILFIKVLLE